MKTYEEAKKNYLLAKEQYDKICLDSGQDVIHEILDEAVKSFEGIEAVRWRQYTPYFDDGNACIFGLQQVLIKPTESFASEIFKGKERSQDGDDADEGFVSEWNLGHYDKSIDSYVMTEAATRLVAFLEKLEARMREEEHLLEKVFGDHTQITYRKGDFFIEECEHD